MKYFAMIEGERRGPFDLHELSEAGVRPNTYVWCKGMDDWEKAEDVADICRYYRQRLFDMMHGGTAEATPEHHEQPPAPPAGSADEYSNVPLRFRGMLRDAGADPAGFQDTDTDNDRDLTRPPMPTIFLSVMMTLMCCPLTGLVAVYYSFRARKAWLESFRDDPGGNKTLHSDAERLELRRRAHDYERQAKMWIGITFFVFIIITALIGLRLG